jgi:DNA-binding protein HU-beta
LRDSDERKHHLCIVPQSAVFLKTKLEGGDCMNKGDLVGEVAKIVKNKKVAEKVVGCVTNTIAGALKKGDKVTLIGFGTFSVAKRAARTGRNPQTGKEIKIKAKKVPKFVAGKKLKAAVAK